MRLRSKEANEIAKVMKKYRLGDDYILVKKRGWVSVVLKSNSFQFHRKISQKLAGGEFQKQDQYFVQENKSKISVDDFSKVIENLEQWIMHQL